MTKVRRNANPGRALKLGCKLFDNCFGCPYPCCLDVEDTATDIRELRKAGYSEAEIHELLDKLGRRYSEAKVGRPEMGGKR